MSKTVDRLFGHADPVRAAMAGVDWASTPLGPSAGWPEALRSVLRMVFSSRFSMWMGWGPELTFFYNEAYRRDTLRAKHPWALGMPLREVWPEIWAEIEPRIDLVLSTGEATWDEGLMLFLERSGYPEETYHTFSYSPLANAEGNTGGVLCVVAEDTDRVLAERRLATLRDLGAAVTATQTHAEVLTAVQRTLLGNRKDVPFGLIYLFERDGSARLAASTGVEPGPVSPAVLPADATDPWPVAGLPDAGVVVVEGLIGPVVQTPGGAWPQPPQAAAVIPLAVPGEGMPLGFLVVGLNPYRRFDDGYRGFVELLASQLTSGLRNAESHEAQRRRAESLTELDRAKTAFFANISHEFRTSLTLIMGPVADLREGAADEPELRTTLDLVHRNGLRLSKLVNSLLDFARIEAGQAKAELVPLDLAALTTDLAGMFRGTTDRAGLRLEVDCPPLPQPAWVDRDMWEKVVLNLLSNAVKFTLQGRITVRMWADGNDVVTEVADTGAGIPVDELDALFERFHQVAGTRARSGEGSGIGLALARELVRLHGGDITVRSTLGTGSTFTARIPAGRGAGRPVATDRTDGRVAAAYVVEAMRWIPDGENVVPDSMPAPAARADLGVDGTDGRVLIVDDNADMLAYLRRLLGARWDVETVSDGGAALAAARRRPPDLVVSDVMMPGLDGISLVTALRADPTTAMVPVLLLSARAGTEAAVEGLDSGADDYLVKPFSTAELLARVDGHLRLGQARREAEHRFRALADATPAMIWVDGPDGGREFGNRSWQEFTGLAPAGSGTTWRAHIHPEDRERYDAERARAQAVAAPFTVEYRLRAADGTYRWVNDTGAPAGGGSGYVGGCIDIDARHRERERQRLLAALGAELDRETGSSGRQRVLLRAVVDAGLARSARLDILDGGHAVTVVGAEDPGEPDPDAAHRALTERVAVVLAQEAPSRVVVPLSARSRAVGLLTIVRDAPPDPAELGVLGEIAERSATALDNAALLERERETARRLDVLQRATAELSAAADPAAVAVVVGTHFGRLFGTPTVGVWALRERTRLDAMDVSSWDPAGRPDIASIPADADVPMAVAARGRDVVWRSDGPAGRVTVGAVPLLAGERCVGVVAVAFPEARALDDTGRTVALALADQAARALERAGLMATESTARRAAEVLSGIVSALSGTTTPTQVARIAEGYGRSLGADEVVVAQGNSERLTVLRPGGRTSVPGSVRQAASTGTPLWGVPDDAGACVDVAVPLLLGDLPIGALGLRFPAGTVPIGAEGRAAVLTVAGQVAQALDRARLQQIEHEVAEVLQRSLLPDELPLLARLDTAARYVPGTVDTQAAGDWYGLLPLDGDRVAIVVGDVVGHGPPAAAVMGKLSAALSAFLLEGNAPAAALEKLDRVAHRTPGARGSTCVCLTLDWSTGELRWARAGHLPVLVVGGSAEARFLEDGGGTVLGVSGRPPYREASTTLPPGAVVLAFTDGLVERRGEVVDEGLERLCLAAAANANHPAEELADVVLARALDGAPADDVALIIVRRVPEPLVLRRPARPGVLHELRDLVERWAHGCGLGGERVDDLQLAVNEAVSNAVEHAYPPDARGEFTCDLRRTDDGAIAVVVRDFGRWRPPPADQGFRGRGLMMIRALAEDVTVEQHDEGTTVRFRIGGGAPDGTTAPELPAAMAFRPATPFAVTATVADRGPVLVGSGDLDRDGADALRPVMLRALAEHPRVVLDLRAVGFLGSAGIGLLAEAAAGGGSGAGGSGPGGSGLSLLVSAGSPVARVLALTETDTVVRVQMS